jgi:enoyl-CoA hydratase/carnithine racemase
VFDDDALMPHVAQYAANIATYSAPRSLAAMKAQIWTAIDDDYTTAFAAADKEQDIASASADFREAFASYREQRVPKFGGR